MDSSATNLDIIFMEERSLILSISNPPNRGIIKLGKQYIEYNDPYISRLTVAISESSILID